MPKKDICSVLLSLPDEKLKVLEHLIELLNNDGGESTVTDKTVVENNANQDAEPEGGEVG